MQFIPYRMLRNEPGKLSEQLKSEGQLVVTRNGEPFALLVDIDPGGLDEILTLISRLRAQQALSALRAEARQRGLDSLPPEEIDGEIRSVRKARKKKK